MSKKTNAFFEQLKNGEEPGLAESIRDAAASLKEVAGQLWDAAKPMFDHGRTEAAAALFIGNAHVMYMKGADGVEQDQEPGKDEPQQQQEQGGREM
ncbi:hypothetical protein [Frigoriglobus tundricola]|uniref:Uncharacterized protein n=1 Tax=Frigoriglobus tundricola TaxID=2774151 RepID=A0A6M5YIX8_9BACT|nr:hypothetical protein [Frigoriglobus tundricola]QJW93236.1 hypothetical protein FTUN_0741 [Frigoriglobus tundricola]